MNAQRNQPGDADRREHIRRVADAAHDSVSHVLSMLEGELKDEFRSEIGHLETLRGLLEAKAQ